MKKLVLLMLVLAFASMFAEEVKWVNPGPVEAEAVLSKVIAKRIERLEKALPGFHFDKSWVPKVSLEWGLSGHGANMAAAEYCAEIETIKFPMSLSSSLTVKYDKIPLRLLDPEVLAKDSDFGELADHELGHRLMDQISRKVLGRPWFTVAWFNSLNRQEALGVNIISEGVGMYFQRIGCPRMDKLSPFYFPDEEGHYTYEMIVFDGGHWLVHDILSRYEERGLIWLITHPFVASDENLREAAIKYRQKALWELRKK